MKTKFLIVTILLGSLIFFLANAYAHYPARYGKEDIKVETKKVDNGIQLTITSDDPKVAKEVQENVRYYEDVLASSEYCPHMADMSSRHHSCMW